MSTESNPELASTMVQLLGRELMSAKARIGQLEREATMPLSNNEAGAAANDRDEELSFLRRQLSNAQDAFEAMKKRAEEAESALAMLEGDADPAKKDKTSIQSAIGVSQENGDVHRQVPEFERTPTSREACISQAEVDKKGHSEKENPVQISKLQRELADMADKFNNQHKEKCDLHQQKNDIERGYQEMENRLEETLAQHEETDRARLEEIQCIESQLERLRVKYKKQKEVKGSLRTTCQDLEISLQTALDSKTASETTMEEFQVLQQNQSESRIELERKEQLIETQKSEISGLRVKLEKANEKRQAHKEGKIALREVTIAIICPRQIPCSSMSIPQTAENLENELKELREAKQKAAQSAPWLQRIRQTFYNNPAFFTFMATLPSPAIRPGHNFLLPVGHARMDLASQLASILRGILDVDAITTQQQRDHFSEMYRTGTLRVDCMILQCVDFNHELYNQLLRLAKHPVPRKRDSQEPLQGSVNKKTKF
ncbi:hypothetical protein H0H81_011669 [Sphagnurus paluster]|uniref:Uncharacterized protein n=1 Tax=Sphagnurus paluster TaxID=117069 RepID=A0A9P7FV05_9AGAR|nr:hypothetical protein H0H81_011669 [Sphagnurus paluster]